jgi:hypothetical protein
MQFHLFLQFLLCKHRQFIPEYFLGVEDLLVVHFLDEAVVLDSVRLEELHVGHLEGLPNGLGDELGLQEGKVRLTATGPTPPPTSSLSNTWQIILGVVPMTVSSSPAAGSTRRLAMITTSSPMSAMYEMVLRPWSIMISFRSVFSTMIFSVEMKRSTSVLGCPSPSGACAVARSGPHEYKLGGQLGLIGL